MRIVSMIASATEIIHALGLGEFQVGRSHECDFPGSVVDLPVVTRPRFDVHGTSQEIDARVRETLAEAGSVYEVLTGELDALEPTHIVTQTQCQVCAVSMEDVERALSESMRSRPEVVALEPNSLADIWDDIQRVADRCGVAERGRELIASLRARMAAMSGGSSRKRVACIEWQEPLMAAGNWVPELIEMVGAVNLFGDAGKHSPWMTFEDLEASDPDVILVMPCGYGLPQARAEMHWLEDRGAGWTGLRAVRAGEVYLLDGNQYLNRPGPRVVESMQMLAEILYPERFAPALGGGVGWERRP
ncbi:MAG TPA: cobalamin-binding protein [Bryobacteraceae bacterium]